MIVAGLPGSRSNTTMVGESMLPHRAMGAWISRAARLADQASAATESSRQYSIEPPRSPGPATGTHPAGAVLGAALLEERLSGHAVRPAPQGDPPVADMVQHHWRDPDVVVDDLGFGEAGQRVHDLVEVANRQLPAAHGDRDSLGTAHRWHPGPRLRSARGLWHRHALCSAHR